ncbi:MAG: Hsp70 family protein [Bacteroidales bacterium]|nr:Hsp70 family protein [Bacteroidales bacterium]
MVYGIDLGTTYSCIAQFEGYNRPSVIPTENGHNFLPSVVQFKPDGKILVGATAKRQAESNIAADQVLSLFKRQMGHQYCEQTIPSNDGTRKVSPIEGSACILRKLISPVLEQNKANGVTARPRAVISIPTGFTGWQRAATKQAAELAGIEVLGLIHEPTAAALSFNINAGERILVFDLGGGTLDVSIVHHYEAGKYRVLASSSDYGVLGHYLGGQDWDRLLAEEIANQSDINVDFDNPTGDQRCLRAAIMNRAEVVKKNLTDDESCTDILPRCDKEFTITRSNFENLTMQLTQQCLLVVDEAIRRSGLSETELRQMRFVTVGGSSYMPMIRNTLMRNYGGRIGTGDPYQWFPQGNPGQAIAEGAAIYAYLLESNKASIYELSSHSYGTLYHDKVNFYIKNLIRYSENMEYSKDYVFNPHENGQPAVSVDIWENERDEEDFPFPIEDQERNIDRRIFYEQYTFSNPNATTKETQVNFSISRDKSGLMSLTVNSDGSPSRTYQIKPLQDDECLTIRERLKNVQ